MVKKELKDFIKENLERGYSKEHIKRYLIKAGYPTKEVEKALRYSNSPAQLILVIGVLVVIFVVAIILMFQFLKTAPEKPEAEISVAAVGKTTVMPGDALTTLISLTNVGTAKLFEVMLTFALVDEQGRVVEEAGKKNVTVATVATLPQSVEVPEEPGNYTLRVGAEYAGDYKISEITFMVVAPTETEIKCPPTCEDFDVCTSDYCIEEEGICAHEIIQPCCGNLICEAGESYETCSFDCPKPIGDLSPEEITGFDINSLTKRKLLEFIKNESLKNPANPVRAARYCNAIEKTDLKDSCFYQIAGVTNQSRYCGYVSDVVSKDNCYMNYVINKRDFEVCSKIIDNFKKETCQTLKELNQ